jgi:Zn-dependent protease with chaperone function/flagellar biosynthesis regulator FlbT
VAAATFFEHQHLARRNTVVMVVLFSLAVVAVIVAVDLLISFIFLSMSDGEGPRRVPLTLHAGVAAITAGIIFLVSVVNIFKLADGGEAVAKMVGARQVTADTRDPLERRLVNVVEEMAIASGVRVPGVYIMDNERGINAFAAGWDVSGAVIAVTRGTLEQLNRDELQGVIGHEFSHILNADMRLNIRMIGVLAGIVFIGSIGQFLMRNMSNADDWRAAAAMFLGGLALFLIGYVGLFFARLIKAAVSRQREFLADASSVQFTRNPDGIAGALDQIRASSAGALIASRHAEHMSHMFFGQGIKVWLGGIFDTHPPVEERIQRVNPRFQASAYRGKRPVAAVAEGPSADTGFGAGAVAGFASGAAAAPVAGRRAADVGSAWGRSAGESARMVGTLDAGKMDHAGRLLASLPPGLRESVRDVDGARAAMIALMLAPRDEVMQQQLAAVAAASPGPLAERARAAVSLARALPPALHLPVIDLALPAVKAASEQAKKELVAGLEAVVRADRRMSLHQFVIITLVKEQLAPKPKQGAAPMKKLAELQTECAVLLMLVAHAGTRADASGTRQDSLQAAVRAGAREMAIAEDAALAAKLSVDAASSALQALKALAPLQKALLVKGLFAAATADGKINVAEAEMMRLTGAVLDCPLPPILVEQDPLALAA